jgi:hypothetical protein
MAHVLPTDDGFSHDLSTGCRCHPRTFGDVVLHEPLSAWGEFEELVTATRLEQGTPA